MPSKIVSKTPPATPGATPPVRYLIGVDGGGTGTRVRLLSADGVGLGHGEAGPSALGQGEEQAWRHILQAINRAFDSAGLATAPTLDCALALGLAGADVLTRRERFLALAPSFGELLLHSDAQTTLSGAHAGRPGAIVAIGTGSIGLAFGVDGSRRMSNGWGFPVGDEGSGAWLGLRSMQLAQQALDGRVATGALARAVFLVAGSNRAELLAWCEQAGQQRYATLAPLVFETEAADPQAAALLARAVLAIEQTVAAIDPAGTLPLALCGSLGRRFEPRLGAAVRARCVAPAGDAVDGALCLLRQHLDHHFARATR